MFTVIGLSLDVVGAVALAVGLFRAPIPLTLGWLRAPEDAAEDRAYGTSAAYF
jgi:hypothetical protein